MRIGIIMSAVCTIFNMTHTLDVPPQIRSILAGFGVQQSIDMKRLSFRQHETYFHTYPNKQLHFEEPNILYMSPQFQKSLLAELEQPDGSYNPQNAAALWDKDFKRYVSLTCPLKPHIQEAVRDFYEQHGISEALFLMDKKNLCDPRAIAQVNTRERTIELGRSLQQRLEKRLKHNMDFEPSDQLALLHEYGHLIQTDANTLLQQYSSQLPFEVDTAHTNEFAADLYAFITMKPSVLTRLMKVSNVILQAYVRSKTRLEHLNSQEYSFWNPTSLRYPLQAMLVGWYVEFLEDLLTSGDPDGQHANFLQRCSLKEIACGIHAQHIQEYRLRGYNLDEIEHAWPRKPLLRRITATTDINTR